MKTKEEAAADEFVRLGNQLGLTRIEMATVCGALFANHAVASGVEIERAHAIVDAFWEMRSVSPSGPHILVRKP